MMTGVTAPVPAPACDLSRERAQAMTFAVELHRERFNRGPETNRAVIETATEIFRWVTAAVTFVIDFGPVVGQQTGRDAGYSFGGKTMSQLRATDQVTGRVRTYDARRNEVLDDPGTDADNIAWSLADGGEAVVMLSIDEDTRGFTLVAGMLGSTVLTARIETADGPREVTQAIDVIPGDIATMEIQMGEPTPQPSDEPVPG